MGTAGAITAVCMCVTEIAKFLQTPEGQETVKDIRSNNAVVVKAVVEFGQWVEDLFKESK